MVKDFYDGMTLDEIYTKRIKYNSPVLERLSTLESILKNIKVQFTGNYNDLTNKPDLTIYAVNSEIQDQLDSIGISIYDIEEELARLETDKVDYTDGNIDLATGKTYKINNISIFDIIYPIGSIYQSTDSTSPSSLFGGTWEVFGSGRVLVGLDTSQTEFNEIGKVGGAKTHSLTANENGPHIHDRIIYSITGVEYGGGNCTTGSGPLCFGESGYFRTNSSGEGQAHNNLQPYVVVYRWRRII